jgi:hypothetical protein
MSHPQFIKARSILFSLCSPKLGKGCCAAFLKAVVTTALQNPLKDKPCPNLQCARFKRQRGLAEIAQ